ncbi:hypothetical protein CRUP_005095 [Coryphaenoides rupestris]|nr:hypothetical protein CRUP_005095 [Coryphaenoides rupestris]
MEQCASAASLLASVREQERQFEMLSRALEEERRSCAGTLPRPLPVTQNGRVPCDADIERLTLNEGYVNGTHHFRMEPGQLMQEAYAEGDPQESSPMVSMEATDTTGMKMSKPTITRTVMPSVSDNMSLDGGSVIGGYGTTPMNYRQAPGGPDYPTYTVPRNYHYGPPGGGYEDYRGGPPPADAYASLSRGARMDDRYRPVHPDGYRTLDPNYRAASRNQLDTYAAQPQVGRMGSALELSGMTRFVPEHYGLEDDQHSMGYPDEPDYGMGPSMHYSTVPRNQNVYTPQGPPRRTGSYEGILDSGGDMYYCGGGAPLAYGERGSMASLDSTLRKGPGPGGWRQPELPEVIAMLNYRLDPVKSNAAAFLQHLTFKNDKMKTEVRRMKGIPALVSMLDNPSKEVHHAACGALKNISYGRDAENKIAIKNCDGVPALVRLLRKTRDQDLTDTITVKMEIVDHALHALSDEVMVPRSGWERSINGAGGGEENCKPRHLEWETALTNTAGCLRNVSSERSEARRKLRECTGLVDSLMYIVQSQIDCKDVDNKLIENSMCLLRNLSYHVHQEIPGYERYQEALPINQGPAPSSQKGGCFSSRKGKVKMEIVDHALHALSDEVMVPRSGWERSINGAGGGEENCKPRHLEWETALTNTAGCLRNVSSERSEARRKLRECTGLVDSLMYIVQSQIDCKDVDNKLIENSMCLLRNLSYHVHQEIPGYERYQEALPINQGPAPSSQKGGCFSSRKGKDAHIFLEFLPRLAGSVSTVPASDRNVSSERSEARRKLRECTGLVDSLMYIVQSQIDCKDVDNKDDDGASDMIDIPKRTTAAKGYELLFQPEVVRIYTSLLKESQNPTVLEASAGAVQNLCAGRWTYGRYIRALLRQEKGLPMMTELLAHSNDRVVRAMSGALRNLAIDARNRDLLGKHSVPHLVANLPGGGQSQPVRALSEETVVSILGTLHEVLGSSLEAAKTLRASQGIERLEIPGYERYQEALPINQGPAPSSQKGGCFSSRKGKGRQDDDGASDMIDIPKRTTAAKGYELLFQPDGGGVSYTSLLKESQNPTVLEASAGAVQNLCAGRWTYGRYIRALLRQEKGLPMMTELLAHSNDRVCAPCKHSVPHLVANLPGGGQSQPVRALSEETVVSILGTLHEVRGAGLVLQTVWGYKELRRTLEKDGWKKTDFMVNLNPPSSNARANGSGLNVQACLENNF